MRVSATDRYKRKTNARYHSSITKVKIKFQKAYAAFLMWILQTHNYAGGEEFRFVLCGNDGNTLFSSFNRSFLIAYILHIKLFEIFHIKCHFHARNLGTIQFFVFTLITLRYLKICNANISWFHFDLQCWWHNIWDSFKVDWLNMFEHQSITARNYYYWDFRVDFRVVLYCQAIEKRK